MIKLDDISKSYGNNKVLDKINLTLEAGKVFGIVGANGAGKTTLFRCIADLERHDGEVHSNYSKLKNHIGYLQTNPIFMSRITGWEYLKLLCVARGIKQDDFEAQNIFELPLNQYAETYSTGMKKKLALLGILLQKNDVYILDEPFNGVDIHSNMIISAIIEKLKAAGKIVLMSSHIFSTLSDKCDKIFLLKEGHIVKAVEQEDYKALDQEMKEMILSSKLDHLNFD